MLRGTGPRIEIGHDSPALTEGFHDPEASHRWTDGRGCLAPGLVASFIGGFVVEVELAETELRYVEAPSAAAEASSRSGTDTPGLRLRKSGLALTPPSAALHGLARCR